MADLALAPSKVLLDLKSNALADFTEAAFQTGLRFVALSPDAEQEPEESYADVSLVKFSFAPQAVETVVTAPTTGGSTARLADESPAFDGGSPSLVPESPALDGSAAMAVVSVNREQFPEAMLDPTIISTGTARPDASPFDELLASNDAVDPLRYRLYADKEESNGLSLAA